MQSSLSFSQSAAGGVMALVVKLATVSEGEGADVNYELLFFFFCSFNLIVAASFSSDALSTSKT